MRLGGALIFRTREFIQAKDCFIKAGQPPWPLQQEYSPERPSLATQPFYQSQCPGLGEGALIFSHNRVLWGQRAI